jgi:tetratricopeptide (TPR) repeat protein
LGNVLQNQERYAEAVHAYQEAIRIAPMHAEAHFNLGVSYQRRRLHDQALGSLDRAIEIRPQFVEAHWYKAFITLLMGDYERGWDEYEWRLRQKANIPRPFIQPVWDGSDLDGRTILVHDEQGYGDTFEFVRYLPLVKARGGRLVFECHAKLAAVLKGLEGYDQIVERVSPHHVPEIDFDTHIHLMSLPRVFGTRLETVPQNVPYIKADPERVQYWCERIEDDHNFKVGLAWSSAGSIRSCNLSDFKPLAGIEGLSLYSLQKGPGAEQADAPPAGMELIRWDREMDLTERFVDTAALMTNLDLIISVDTSTVHLAGAMGRPVWTLLSAAPDWRWTHEGKQTPWYPTMRLFRQNEQGDWAGVFAQVKESLLTLLQQRHK